MSHHSSPVRSLPCRRSGHGGPIEAGSQSPPQMSLVALQRRAITSSSSSSAAPSYPIEFLTNGQASPRMAKTSLLAVIDSALALLNDEDLFEDDCGSLFQGATAGNATSLRQ